MAQRVEVTLVDDLDGGTADETVSFSLDGNQYEIDLSATNATRLREGLEEFVTFGRRVAGKTGRVRQGRPPGTSRGTSKTAEIRAWANEQGIAINSRGRIPADITEQYEKAQRDAQAPAPSPAPTKATTRPRKAAQSPVTVAFSTEGRDSNRNAGTPPKQAASKRTVKAPKKAAARAGTARRGGRTV